MNPAFLQLVACKRGRLGGGKLCSRRPQIADHNVIGARKQVAVPAIQILQSGLRGQHRQTGETEQGRDHQERRTGPNASSVLGYSVVQSEVGMVGHWRKYNHGFGPGRGADDALDFYIDDGARSQ